MTENIRRNNFPISTRVIFLSFLLFTCGLLAGCGKDKVDYQNISDTMKPEGNLLSQQRNQQDPAQDTEGFGEGDLESIEGNEVDYFSQDNTSDEYKATYGRSTAPLTPVYFEFDSSSIRGEQLGKLTDSGNHLLSTDFNSLTLEGNCDERGTQDYNLALGEVRARNVKKYLINMGVSAEKITTISYGSQRPLYSGNSEDAYAANRRVDLVLPGNW